MATTYTVSKTITSVAVEWAVALSSVEADAALLAVALEVVALAAVSVAVARVVAVPAQDSKSEERKVKRK